MRMPNQVEPTTGFHYYNPTLGAYNAQAPLRLAPRLASVQGYVDHAAYWVDMFGLKRCWLKVNATKDHYVYHCMNTAGDTTYVGITKHPRLRAMQHALSHPITRPKDGMVLLNRKSPLGKYEARGVGTASDRENWNAKAHGSHD